MVDARLVRASFSSVTMNVSALTMEANPMLREEAMGPAESNEDGRWSCDLRGERMEAGPCPV